MILEKPQEITQTITQQTKQHGLDLLFMFKQYLRDGYFLSRHNYLQENLYFDSLINTINSIIDADLPYVFPDIDTLSRTKLKLLLKHIAQKCPFTPNISELSRNLNIANDNTLKKYLFYLSEGEVLTNLYSANKSHKDFQKPQKIFLSNTNFAFAYDDAPHLGTIRETFMANCLRYQGNLTAPTQGDFCLDGQWTFEIGGRFKNKRQIKFIKQAHVVADDILFCEHDHLPIWIFGFLW